MSKGTFNKYLYSEDGGEGVDAYVIDTGTNVDHVDFEGRAKWGKTIPTGDEDADGNGHGTHCSGTVAGKKFGVAKKANVYAVKVLKSNGSGTMADVVKGVEWAATAHTDTVSAAKKGKKKGFKGSVANMSLGGGKSRTLDLAVNAAVDVGLHFAVAAGNDNADACKYSPAAAENAVTVGASTLADERAYFSNFGECTDIFAPGLNILSTWVSSISSCLRHKSTNIPRRSVPSTPRTSLAVPRWLRLTSVACWRTCSPCSPPPTQLTPLPRSLPNALRPTSLLLAPAMLFPTFPRTLPTFSHGTVVARPTTLPSLRRVGTVLLARRVSSLRACALSKGVAPKKPTPPTVKS
jgi:hypothetical protein